MIAPTSARGNGAQRLGSALCLLCAWCCMTGGAHAAFTLTETFTLTTTGAHNNLTFDGSRWYIAHGLSNTYTTYQSNFTPISTTTLAGFGDTRGMTWDANSDHLFVGNFSPGHVREITKTGSTISQFTALTQLEGLAYDSRDDTLWISYFSGVIEHRTRTGAVLSSFTTPGLEWAGIAIDTVSNTLLIMEDDDLVFEYTMTGVQVGVPIPIDQMQGNGLGLYYDSSLGRLWATSQESRITIFDDPSRVPEPGGIVTFAAALMMLVAHGPRRRVSVIDS